MKIDRLLGILNILGRKEMVTAPQLAERFEVSRRTINRDIEDICKAGIPVVTKQGAGGGIYIEEGYKLDKSLIKAGELSDMVTALKGLGSVSRGDDIKYLLNKITSTDSGATEGEIITIDLASFYKGSLTEKIEKIKEAITNKKIIQFTYYSKHGEFIRKIEPYQIIYKWSDWYVHGYCLYKCDFRMFKLNRLWSLTITQDDYKKRDIPKEKKEFGSHLTDENKFKAIFQPGVKYLLVEAYGPDSFTENEDGTLLFVRGYTNKDYIISWLLEFGDKVKVVHPPELANAIKEKADSISKIYKNERDI